ncbi:hypothetical protein Scep_022438 [Stephania cephalantha]|uniref:Uncharacterized protein n=1 Tax=Stephania cephalantha TaxID=152367 RepID=A0AAP0FHJ6_9MAGN
MLPAVAVPRGPLFSGSCSPGEFPPAGGDPDAGSVRWDAAGNDGDDADRDGAGDDIFRAVDRDHGADMGAGRVGGVRGCGRGWRPPGSDRVDYARSRIADTASHVKDYAREYGGYLQSRVKDAAPSA